MPMRTFPRETKDSIEKLYGEDILRHFPRYGEFWSRFIGVKVRNGHLLPYGLRIPCQISNIDRSRIRRTYDEMCMAHYSMFCHLAGAHFQAQNLSLINHDPTVTPHVTLQAAVTLQATTTTSTVSPPPSAIPFIGVTEILLAIILGLFVVARRKREKLGLG